MASENSRRQIALSEQRSQHHFRNELRRFGKMAAIIQPLARVKINLPVKTVPAFRNSQQN
jgi:hypothetical protein